MNNEIKAVETELAGAKKVAYRLKSEIDKKQKTRAELRSEIRVLSPEYAFAVADVNALEKKLGALQNPDGAAQTIVVNTATEKGRS